MHIVPAPAESLMKSRVLSIPGLQGVMDTGFSDFTQVGAVACGGVGERALPLLHAFRCWLKPMQAQQRKEGVEVRGRVGGARAPPHPFQTLWLSPV